MEKRLGSLTVWTKGDQRAPHKPLLLLLNLARLQRGEERLVSYADVEQPLADLLREFGPSRRNYHPEFPFWHLQSDGIWELTDRAKALTPAGKISVRSLRDAGVKGGLVSELWKMLKRDPNALAEAANLLLDAHFPATVHDDILDAVGLDITISATAQTEKRIRVPAFREQVLRAYDYRCAICGFDVRLRHGHFRQPAKAGPRKHRQLSATSRHSRVGGNPGSSGSYRPEQSFTATLDCRT